MMMCGGAVAVLLSLLALCGGSLATAEESGAVSQSPPFCRSLECPKYQLVKEYQTFEQRAYEATRWVTTQVEQDYFGFGIVTSFRRLFKYISGNNTQGIKIPMTVPVMTVVPLTRPTNVTMSFFVPSALPTPPSPLNPDVYLESYPAQYMYVRSFSGYALRSDFEKNAKALSEELETLGKPFDDSFYASAGYDAPFMLFNRHNEVWFMAK
ncbi:heme-binding protein 2-like [Ascaphus truei]|uniref:heme-binding protein 2-like n=1 Tax=Ascaphus truei TaxID=8439 RepID=UPI003F5A473B